MAYVRKSDLVPFRTIGIKLGISSRIAQSACHSGLEKIKAEFEARGIDFQELFYD